MLAKNFNSVLKVKKINSLVLRKKFINKVDLDFISQLNSSFFLDNQDVNLLNTSNIFDIKTDLYQVLKKLKIQKRLFFKETSLGKNVENQCLNLQSSKLFCSEIELDKKLKSKSLNFDFLILKNQVNNMEKTTCLSTSNNTGVDYYSFSKGFKVYNKHFRFSKIEKQTLLLKILKEKRFLKKVFEAKFFLYSAQRKKKYRAVYTFYDKNRIKIRYLFNIYILSHMKYINVKKFSRKLFKKLVWRRKKRRKWRKSSLYRFYRSRHRLLYKFYIPRHLEVNFKTFDFISCKSLDLPTINAKIPFWLNLRRLLTFLSS